MNIAHVPRRFVANDWGGTETVILETSKRLLAMGHQTAIVCPNALSNCNVETIGGVEVVRVPYFYPYWGLGVETKRRLDKKGGNLFSFALMKTLQHYPGLDLLHLHTAKRTGGIGRHVAMRRRIPYVVSLHGGVYDVPVEETQAWTAPTQGSIEWGKLLGWWVGSRRVLDDAAAVLCVGQQEQRQVQQRFPRKRVLHLPNGVDPQRFACGDGEGFRRRHAIPSQAYVMLTMGRIDPQKNQLFIAHLLPELLKEQLNVHLVFIGHVTNDAYRRQLAGLVKTQGLEHAVTLIDGLDAADQALVDAYHAANVFMLPSIHEPFGIVILEAWAAGLPVIASRVGGVPSLVSEGNDGILFEPNNAREFLQACRLLMQYPDRRYTLAMQGQTKAREHYGWDKITASLTGIYEEVIRENPLRQ